MQARYFVAGHPGVSTGIGPRRQEKSVIFASHGRLLSHGWQSCHGPGPATKYDAFQGHNAGMRLSFR
jgi:hypothetical protein